VVGDPERVEPELFGVAREVTQPPRVLVLRLTLDKGGKKNAELHRADLLAALVSTTGGDRMGT
jgi:hypothetical protein